MHCIRMIYTCGFGVGFGVGAIKDTFAMSLAKRGVNIYNTVFKNMKNDITSK